MEKCIRQLPPLRVTEPLETALMRLAANQERTLSEYIKLVLSHHVFGHALSMDAHESNDKQERA
ncbi:MAG: hypothetical protein RL710_1137 [Pseudomonadota bacterium]|jgi:hypothetical protein